MKKIKQPTQSRSLEQRLTLPKISLQPGLQKKIIHLEQNTYKKYYEKINIDIFSSEKLFDRSTDLK